MFKSMDLPAKANHQGFCYRQVFLKPRTPHVQIGKLGDKVAPSNQVISEQGLFLAHRLCSTIQAPSASSSFQCCVFPGVSFFPPSCPELPMFSLTHPGVLRFRTAWSKARANECIKLIYFRYRFVSSQTKTILSQISAFSSLMLFFCFIKII